MKFEKEYVGLYLSGHPLDEFMDKYNDFNFTSDMIAELKVDQNTEINGFENPNDEAMMALKQSEAQVSDGMVVTCGGIVTEVKKILGKSGNMAFVTVEDIYGTFDVMVFSRSYEKFKNLLFDDALITVHGRVSMRDGKTPVIVADSIIPWDKEKEATPQTGNVKKVYLRFNTTNPDIYAKVKKIATSYPGESDIVVKFLSTNKVFSFNAKVDPSNYLKNEFIGLLGEENVVIK